MRTLAFLILTAASPALADGCPTAPDVTAELAPLYEALQTAQGDMEARVISNKMWQLWLQAPDEPSQSMLNDALRARSSFDYLRATDRLNALVGYCPFYAEGYNQRAFINYLRQDFTAALPDLEEAIKLNPRHVGALSGKALTLFALGRNDEGQVALRAALALNPWLGERALLKPLPGDDL